MITTLYALAFIIVGIEASLILIIYLMIKRRYADALLYAVYLASGIGIIIAASLLALIRTLGAGVH